MKFFKSLFLNKQVIFSLVIFSIVLAVVAFPFQKSIAITAEEAIPQVSSSTHPDSSQWYSEKNPSFNWPLLQEVTGVRLHLSKNPQTTPTLTFIPPINSRSLFNLNDGAWYLHVQFRINSGWGKITHFKFNIDTQKPTSFQIKNAAQQENQKFSFQFESIDRTSGIDYYETKIDEGDFQTVTLDENDIYQTGSLEAGSHQLTARAVDKAGNSLVRSVEFEVEATGISDETIAGASDETPAGTPSNQLMWLLAGLGVVVLILIFFSFYIVHKISKLKKSIYRETQEVRKATEESFKFLKESLRRNIDILKKSREDRSLTSEEKKALNKLKKDLEGAEKFIREEIEDIERRF